MLRNERLCDGSKSFVWRTRSLGIGCEAKFQERNVVIAVNTMKNKVLEDYLERALALFEDGGRRLPDAESLRMAAVASGMSNEESELADKWARELTDTGRKAVAAKNFEDAATPLLHAILYSPIRVEPHHLLAQIYYGRWRQNGDSADRDLAIDLCKKTLELSSEHEGAAQMGRDLGILKQDTLTWKRAGLIVVVLVSFSLAITTFARCVVGSPDAPVGRDGLEASQPVP